MGLAGLFSGPATVLLAAGPGAQKSSAHREIGPFLSTLSILNKLRIIK
jgi:hypothetical protein